MLHADDDLSAGRLYRRGNVWWMAFSSGGKVVRLSTKKRHRDAAERIRQQAAVQISKGADSATTLKAAIHAGSNWSQQWGQLVNTGLERGGWAERVYTQSVRRKKHAHDLTIPQFKDVLLRSGGHCEVTGIRFDFGTQQGRIRPWIPSLDRIDSGGGYTLTNVRITCCVVNLALSHWGDAVLERIAIALLVRKHMNDDCTFGSHLAAGFAQNAVESTA